MQYFRNKIVPMISESSNEMGVFYECFSEEINNSFKRINKSNNISAKLASEGWFGNILALGKSEDINKLGENILEFYESSFDNRGNENSNLWISDEVYKYCYWSQIGGSLSLLNPIYEDFMLLDLK